MARGIGPLRRTECHPDADFMAPLSDVVRHGAVDACDGQDQGERPRKAAAWADAP